MTDQAYADLIVETSTRAKVLEDRFDRHLTEIKTDFKSLLVEFKELSKTLREHENSESKNHFNVHERIVKLESERGVIAKIVNTILAAITGGVAGWLARHS